LNCNRKKKIELLVCTYHEHFDHKSDMFECASQKIVSINKMFVISRHQRSHGLAVRTLDSESSNPSSNLGGTYIFAFSVFFLRQPLIWLSSLSSLISLVFLLKNKSDNSILQLGPVYFCFFFRPAPSETRVSTNHDSQRVLENRDSNAKSTGEKGRPQ
jgi:hypothetical protein